MTLHAQSTSADIAAHTYGTRPNARAALSPERLCQLTLETLQGKRERGVRLDPDALEAFAHQLNDMATEARREEMRG